MSFEKTLGWEFGQEIDVKYSMSPEGLKVDRWTLYSGNAKIIPDRDTSQEIEELVADFLEKEYSVYGYSYNQEMREANWLSSRG